MKHKFTEYIPEELEEDILYISLEYDTASHKCACGCGEEVVTPISPRDWHITYNGDSVTLYPSIGNWSFECRSHYWIKKGRVVWAESWSDEEVSVNRKQDSAIRKKHFSQENKIEADQKSNNKTQKNSFWSWLKNKFE